MNTDEKILPVREKKSSSTTPAQAKYVSSSILRRKTISIDEAGLVRLVKNHCT